jgi:hypothetical protein
MGRSERSGFLPPNRRMGRSGGRDLFAWLVRSIPADRDAFSAAAVLPAMIEWCLNRI